MFGIIKSKCLGSKSNKRNQAPKDANKCYTSQSNRVMFDEKAPQILKIKEQPDSLVSTPQPTSPKPDNRSPKAKMFFPVAVTGWEFHKGDSDKGKVIRMSEQDTVLVLKCDYDNYEVFLAKCHLNDVIMKALDHDLQKLMYDYTDYLYLEKLEYKNRSTRLIVKIVVPCCVTFLLDSEIYTHTKSQVDVNVNELNEVDSKNRYLFQKIDLLLSDSENGAEFIASASELLDIFEILSKLYTFFDLDIYRFIFNLKCR